MHIVDVGAMREGRDRYQPLVDAGIAEITGFEPNPAEFEALSARPGPYRYLRHFLGRGGPATFYRTHYAGCSSLLEPDGRLINLFTGINASVPEGNFQVVERSQVETMRLDDVGAEVVADLLKLDVQGGELDILRGGTGKLRNTLVIDTEVEFVPLYKDQPLLGDIQCFLRDQGFVLHKLIDIAGRSFKPFIMDKPAVPMSQLLWADGIFVRDFTRLDLYSDDDLLRAALILGIVYDSHDLAGLFLQDYDRRRGTSFAEAHRESFKQRKVRVLVANIKDRE